MTPYIFLSHSREDLAKVRKVRDYLEKKSFEPILFNLRCLTDSDELGSLVKREIEARPWFLYLDSPRARSSSRVQAEVAYARDVQKKPVFRVDLDAGWWMQKLALRRALRKMRG